VQINIYPFTDWLLAGTLHMLLPRCMHCMQRGLATRKLSVRPSVCPYMSNV